MISQLVASANTCSPFISGKTDSSGGVAVGKGMTVAGLDGRVDIKVITLGDTLG